MNPTVRTIIIAIAAAIIAVAAYSQVTHYFERRQKIAEQKELIQKSVAESTEGASEILRFEIDDRSITFAELFKRGDDRIEKISDAAIPIGISSLPEEEKKDLKAYMDGLQEVLRSQAAASRKLLAVNSSLEIAKNASNDYSRDYSDFARKRASDTLDEAKKALQDSIEANKAFANRLAAFRKTVETLKPQLEEYSLIDLDLLSNVRKKYADKKKT